MECVQGSPVWDAEALNTPVNGQRVGDVSVIEPIPRGANLCLTREGKDETSRLQS